MQSNPIREFNRCLTWEPAEPTDPTEAAEAASIALLSDLVAMSFDSALDETPVRLASTCRRNAMRSARLLLARFSRNTARLSAASSA